MKSRLKPSISASPTFVTTTAYNGPGSVDLDLVVLPLHLEGGQVERVLSARPAALEAELVVVEEIRFVVRRQHDARTRDVPPAGAEAVREQRVDHRVFVDVVLDGELLGDVAGRRLAFFEWVGCDVAVRRLNEVVALARVVEPAQAGREGPVLVRRIARPRRTPRSVRWSGRYSSGRTRCRSCPAARRCVIQNANAGVSS